ncbi:EF-hand domain-containing protein [Streptomyces sp. NPDC007818]|uniref:EF-hand domain-containing protein n=1 Tax=Streptomyces sp. NPDC007818 TaxID=3364780 RepID=UPI0036C63C12
MTFDEYEAWAGADTFDTVCREALGSLFDLADGADDGCLDREEFTRLRHALGNPADQARAAFDALDEDGDGRVGRDAYLAQIRSFVTGGSAPMARALHA